MPHISILRYGIASATVLFATLHLAAQTTPPKPPPLTVDHDPVRSPDPETSKAPAGDVTKQGGGFVVHADVEEVSLNVTVLDSKGSIVQDLKREDFRVLEDGIQQNLLSFQHADIPVSIGLVIDNSGSMYKKRPSVNKSALDLILAGQVSRKLGVDTFEAYSRLD